jgi:TolB-like protein/class 3 adenylate cyclase/Flp pilus assembly protein TadD
MASTRRLAAILAADVAGYSRLMGADEEGTLDRLKAHRRELIDPKITEHRGRIVKTTGDGLLAEFPSVVDAVRSGAEVQRGMLDREPEVPDERRIRLRIGINLGDVIAEDGDIFGDGVNVAARLEALAEPGGICVSGVVRDQIRGKLPYPLADKGEQSVKNIAEPIRVYALRPEVIADLPPSSVAIAGRTRWRTRRVEIAAATAAALVFAVGFWWIWPTTKPASTPTVAAATPIARPLAAPRLSIVVLPFANLSNDPDQQYFADGITEDVTTDLSRIANMLVISRNTAFTYRNRPADAKQIGRELDVRYVLEGSVQRSGSRVRITAQLIDTENDAHLWAQRFDREAGDLFALQNEITNQIAVVLHREIIAAESARPTERPDALEYILRGRAAYWKPDSRQQQTETIGFFEHALALDPGSVEAQSELANMLAARVMNGWRTGSEDSDITRAEGLVTKALAASPRSALAHYAKGAVLRAQGRCDEAIPEYEAVLSEGDRNWVYFGALTFLARCKFLAGSTEEVISLCQEAIRLSPRDPNIGIPFSLIGLVYLLGSRPDEAVVWFEKARSSNPGAPFWHGYLASAYGLKGEIERAAAELSEARKASGDGRFSSIARLVAVGYAGARSWGVPKVRALFDATYFAGLRKAGVPEE